MRDVQEIATAVASAIASVSLQCEVETDEHVSGSGVVCAYGAAQAAAVAEVRRRCPFHRDATTGTAVPKAAPFVYCQHAQLLVNPFYLGFIWEFIWVNAGIRTCAGVQLCV